MDYGDLLRRFASALGSFPARPADKDYYLRNHDLLDQHLLDQAVYGDYDLEKAYGGDPYRAAWLWNRGDSASGAPHDMDDNRAALLNLLLTVFGGRAGSGVQRSRSDELAEEQSGDEVQKDEEDEQPGDTEGGDA